jgi:hypothetical protein
MATLNGFYLQPHVTQFDGSIYANENCVPASGANGANAQSGGAYRLTGAAVRRKVARYQETDPGTAGWSLADLDLAMARIGVGFSNRSQEGWASVRLLHKTHYLVMQGDSDQFSNHTCSGAYNGGHCIGIHPGTSGTKWWINDPICKVGRWEQEEVIRRYAAKIDARIRFGVFTHSVPMLKRTHTIHLTPFARLRFYTLSGSCIKTWEDRRWGPEASTAGTGAPIYRKTCNNLSGATTALITGGAFVGRYIRIGAQYGVTITKD